jgi:hypothetical protein
VRALRLAFEVASTLAGILAVLGAGGPLAEGVRAVVVVTLAMLGAVVVVVAAVFAAGLLAQRQPPYPM